MFLSVVNYQAEFVLTETASNHQSQSDVSAVGTNEDSSLLASTIDWLSAP